MKHITWISNLVVDTEKMANALAIFFNKPIQIVHGTSGASNSDWIYSHWPIQGGKIFRFAIHLVTGKSLILFIQSDYLWLTGDWENFLIEGLALNQQREGQKIPIDYSWSLETDLGCGSDLLCFGWFNEEDFRGYKQLFAEGMIQGYRDLWKEK